MKVYELIEQLKQKDQEDEVIVLAPPAETDQPFECGILSVENTTIGHNRVVQIVGDINCG